MGKEDLVCISALYRWNQDGLTMWIAWAQDNQAWAAAIQEAVVAMSADETAAR